MKVKVQYRKIFLNGKVNEWRLWHNKPYDSLQLAIKAVEESYGFLYCSKLYKVVFNGEVGIYEIRDIMDYQFSFLVESPWKIGLNDAS